MCNSENSDIAQWNKNYSEWGFSVFFKKKTKSYFFLKNAKKYLKIMKAGGLDFLKQTGFSQPCIKNTVLGKVSPLGKTVSIYEWT